MALKDRLCLSGFGMAASSAEFLAEIVRAVGYPYLCRCALPPRMPEGCLKLMVVKKNERTSARSGLMCP